MEILYRATLGILLIHIYIANLDFHDMTVVSLRSANYNT